MEQKSYTLKECRAFNLEQHDYILQFIRGNYNPKAELKSIVIPDDPHPWKILRSVIKQFYDRECEMARTINFAHCEMERAQYNPQNEMFATFQTKRYFIQNETSSKK